MAVRNVTLDGPMSRLTGREVRLAAMSDLFKGNPRRVPPSPPGPGSGPGPELESRLPRGEHKVRRGVGVWCGCLLRGCGRGGGPGCGLRCEWWRGDGRW